MDTNDEIWDLQGSIRRLQSDNRSLLSRIEKLEKVMNNHTHLSYSGTGDTSRALLKDY